MRQCAVIAYLLQAKSLLLTGKRLSADFIPCIREFLCC
jgi:hypothetical protein